MAITLTVTKGYTYKKGDTVDWEDLNKLGAPTVELPDGKDPNFGIVTISAGTAAAPSLRGADALTSGLFFGEDSVGVAIDGAAVVTIEAGKLTVDGKIVGDIRANVGSKESPGLGFDDVGKIGFAQIGSSGYAVANEEEVFAWNHTLVEFLKPVLGKNAKFDGNVEITGACTVAGALSGSIETVAAGTPSAPGLKISGDTKSGMFGGAGSPTTHRIGFTLNEDSGAALQRKGTSPPYWIITNGPLDQYDWEVTRPAQVHIVADSGRAAIDFEGNAEQAAGALTATFTNAPGNGTPRYVKVLVGGIKGVIPVIPYDWS